MHGWELLPEGARYHIKEVPCGVDRALHTIVRHDGKFRFLDHPGLGIHELKAQAALNGGPHQYCVDYLQMAPAQLRTWRSRQRYKPMHPFMLMEAKAKRFFLLHGMHLFIGLLRTEQHLTVHLPSWAHAYQKKFAYIGDNAMALLVLEATARKGIDRYDVHGILRRSGKQHLLVRAHVHRGDRGWYVVTYRQIRSVSYEEISSAPRSCV